MNKTENKKECLHVVVGVSLAMCLCGGGRRQEEGGRRKEGKKITKYMPLGFGGNLSPGPPRPAPPREGPESPEKV